MALDKLALPLQSVALTAGDFLFPMDFLPDSVSLAGAPISGEYAKTLGNLNFLNDDRLFSILQNQGQAAVTEPVVVASLKDGRWMVMHGEQVVAAALRLGLDALAVQVIPLNEALAGIDDLQKTFYPRRRYRKNLDLMDHRVVAEKSTATSKTRPEITRTSLPWG